MTQILILRIYHKHFDIYIVVVDTLCQLEKFTTSTKQLSSFASFSVEDMP